MLPATNSFRAISAPVTDPPTDGLSWLFLPSDNPVLGVREKEDGIGRAQACWRTHFSQAQVKTSGYSSLPTVPTSEPPSPFHHLPSCHLLAGGCGPFLSLASTHDSRVKAELVESLLFRTLHIYMHACTHTEACTCTHIT